VVRQHRPRHSATAIERIGIGIVLATLSPIAVLRLPLRW
jgi:hypothetical protein